MAGKRDKRRPAPVPWGGGGGGGWGGEFAVAIWLKNVGCPGPRPLERPGHSRSPAGGRGGLEPWVGMVVRRHGVAVCKFYLHDLDAVQAALDRLAKAEDALL